MTTEQKELLENWEKEPICGVTHEFIVDLLAAQRAKDAEIVQYAHYQAQENSSDPMIDFKNAVQKILSQN